MPDNPNSMTTYKRADGGDIDGHTWVHTLDWFEDLDEPIELVEEVWERKSHQTIMVGDEHECAWCPHAKTGEGLG